jgi:hypothetical protein
MTRWEVRILEGEAVFMYPVYTLNVYKARVFIQVTEKNISGLVERAFFQSGDFQSHF